MPSSLKRPERQNAMQDRMSPAAPLLLALLAAGPAQASSALCLAAAERASAETGVPLRLLLAISLTETGRKGASGGLEPWPWALNRGGESLWFQTEDEALAAVEQILAEGTTNVDLGCFQLNWRWHAEAFPSAAAMIDPEENARYAADLVARLYGETGDWRAAVAAYHSTTPDRAEVYLARFDPIYAALGGDQPALATAEAAPRENLFPLLQAGAVLSAGSLVPMAAPPRPMFGG